MRQLMLLVALVSLRLAADSQDSGWQANPQTVRLAAWKQPTSNFDEGRVAPYTLPDLLVRNGATVRSREEWRLRRADILELFRDNVYGRSPGRPDQVRFELLQENPRAMNGAATIKRVAVISRHKGREHRFELTLALPNAPRDPVGVFLLLNNRALSDTDPTRETQSPFWPAERVIARGFGIAALQDVDLAPDDTYHFREGAIRLFEAITSGPRSRNAWAAIAAWAWGASRAMDYFETDPRVNSRRVAVVGHSRGGKAALWAAAEDERFALVVSNESGEGGAALSRRQYGETVAQITKSFPHWFAVNYAGFAGSVKALPIDQHMLLSLIAPRGLYVASADEDLWADPRGEFLSLVHASPVYALWGEPSIAADGMPPLNRPLAVGSRGYHVRAGVHDLTLYDWERFIDFAVRLWRR